MWSLWSSEPWHSLALERAVKSVFAWSWNANLSVTRFALASGSTQQAQSFGVTVAGLSSRHATSQRPTCSSFL